MWNNWVGQIQHTLGEAVEYLREDEEEEEEEEEEPETAAVLTQNHNASESVTAADLARGTTSSDSIAASRSALPRGPPTAEPSAAPPVTSEAPSSSPALDDAVLLRTAATAADVASVAATNQDVVQVTPSHSPGEVPQRDAQAPASVTATAVAAAGNAASNDEDGAVSVAEPAASFFDSTGAAANAAGDFPSALPGPPVTEASEITAIGQKQATSSPPLAADAACEELSQQEPAPQADADIPALSGAPVSEVKAQSLPSNDIHQLLRFQQQLAEEMERVSALEKTNATLVAQVRSLSDELQEAKSQLASSAASGNDIATLIEKLGREKERNKSVLAERNRLMEQVTVLEETTEELRQKSADLDRIIQEQAVSRQHINALEAEKEQFVSQMVELREELQATKEAKEGLSRQLDDVEKNHDSAVSQVRESTSSELEYATREVERLKGALRNATVEYEDRITTLENELSQANRRAHTAESRLNDIERNSAGSLQDLRRELADLQQRTSALTHDLGTSRHAYDELQMKYTALQREHRNQGEKESEDSVALRAAKDNCIALEERIAALKQELAGTQRELESTQWQVESLKASNTHLSASLERARQGAEAASSMARPAESTTMTPLENSLSLSATLRNAALLRSPLSHTTGATSAAVPAPLVNPFLPTHRSSMEGSLDGKARGRLEKEVLRQTMEINRLREVEQEHTKLKRSHEALQVEYDLVLQMYGQAEEELQAARQNKAPRSDTPPTATAVLAVDVAARTESSAPAQSTQVEAKQEDVRRGEEGQPLVSP